ncbi:MAG: hypothetical protein AAF205_08285 [Pseudomonadota bacterium]
MKTMTGSTAVPGSLLAALLVLAACDRTPDPTPAEAEPRTATEIAEDDVEPLSIPEEDLRIVEETPTMVFRWQVPPALARHPKLFADMRVAAEASRIKLGELAREEAQFRVERDLPPAPVSEDTSWTVSYRSPALLSLVGETHSYTGGAHPNLTYGSILWDRQNEAPLSAYDLFEDAAAAKTEIALRYCAALERARADRRGDAVIEGKYGECPAIDDQPVVPVGSSETGIAMIRVLLAPYVAGPYAEGAYQVDVEMDEDLSAMLRNDVIGDET